MQKHSKMAVITMRTRSCHPRAEDLLRIKHQLQLSLQLSGQVPGIWFWAVGPPSDKEASALEPDPEPQIHKLCEQIADLLRGTAQPVLGVAVGQVSTLAAMVLGACDYVFALKNKLPTEKAELACGGQECCDQLQKSCFSSADVVLETTEALYNRCHRMAGQIENMSHKELLYTKKTFQKLRLHRLGKAGKSEHQDGLGSQSCQLLRCKTMLGTVAEEDSSEQLNISEHDKQLA